MRILLVTPAPPGSRLGNRVTAVRYRAHLRALGHRVRIATELVDGAWDVVFALHAKKSADAVSRCREAGIPVVLVLTGTDLYRDIRESRVAQRALAEADRLVVLQAQGRRELPAALRRKVRVIEQSAVMPRVARSTRFDVAVIGHLRAEKDPFLVARAVTLLPESSAIRVVHVGRALDDAHRRRAERESAHNPRWRWVGERSPRAARTRIARARLLVVPSIIEGGANVIAEAIVAGTAVLASRIPSSVGMLGGDHPGFFPVGDAEALARLLSRAERDAGYRSKLVAHGKRRRALFLPARERALLRSLLSELVR